MLGAAAAAAAWAPLPQDEAPVTAGIGAAPIGKADSANSKSVLAQLPAREAIGKRRGELFPPQSWAPPPPKRATAAKVAPPAPAPPPMPYRVAGRVVHDGVAHVVLAKGDRVLTVREGDTLEDGYRVQSIGAQGVALVYLPLGVPQMLPAALALEHAAAPVSAAADSRRARLRLEGPARIRAGDPFSVALKVTSDQAVRSAPLQLSFDAQLLEAVDVRRGGFFADGSFSYRINPAGSIFIGAAAGSGAIPADAEFFVVTFKTVRPGAAELKLSSVLLQGAAGRAIAHDQPAALRTSIVQ